jgi:hypothetical protein
MVPRASTAQRWPLRPWRSQRKMYAVSLIYRGALRRRIRRLVRSRVFNNARTATRNLDLPLAIGDPIATQLFLLHRRILASAWRPQRRPFSGIRRFALAEKGQGLPDNLVMEAYACDLDVAPLYKYFGSGTSWR